jgi:hypothetical protein
MKCQAAVKIYVVTLYRYSKNLQNVLTIELIGKKIKYRLLLLVKMTGVCVSMCVCGWVHVVTQWPEGPGKL